MDEDQNSEQEPAGEEPEGQEPTLSESAPEAEPAPPVLGSAGATLEAAENRGATQQGFMERVRSFFRGK